MDDFIIQGDEPIIKVDSLGIGITDEEIKRLSLSDSEYLVIGDRQGTTNYNTNNMDTKYNMYVNNRGVAINTSRSISSNYRDPNTSLYIGGNLQCDGIINAHSIQFSNISIKGELNSNAIINLITQVRDFTQSQPFRAGIKTYFNNIYNINYPVNNIYTPDYITLGGLVDTNNNQHPLNINSTPNNNFDNIHLAMRNDTIYDDITSNLSKFSIGIIGGSNISPAVISTTKGMPLEFHISKSSSEINSLYNKNAIPTYLNDTQFAAMTIDSNGNVCIGKNKADSILYRKKIVTNNVVSEIVVNTYPHLDVHGTSKFEDVVLFDNYTKDYKNIDDIYIRTDGIGILNPSQISAGDFHGSNYKFNNDITVVNNIFGKKIELSDTLKSSNATINNLIVNTDSTFYGDVSFDTANTLSMRSLNIENDLLIGNIRINPINITDYTMGLTTTSNTIDGSNYFFTYVHSNIANLDANRNISFPNKLTVGPNISEGFPGVLNVYKNRSSNANFEIVLQEKINSDKFITNIGRLSHLDLYDNSLIINTNNINGISNNIYFYPSFDISTLKNNIFLPNLINTPPMLSITNKGIGINIKIPRQADGKDLHLDIIGKMSATGYYVSQDNAIAKMSGFIYNDKNYFNIYNTNTYKYCINYDNVSSYSTKMRGLNVKEGINADMYYQNDKPIATLQATNNLNSSYTNQKIALGWSGEDVNLPLQIRNTNIEEYNYSVIRIYRGVRGGGINNNADYSGIDICEYDRDLNGSRNLEKWFIYKNHKYNDVDTRDTKRVGPLQFGYTDKTITPTTYGMSMYYNSLNSNYHIDFNNPNVSYDFVDNSSNTAVSIYGDLDVYGNINIIDNNSNNFNFRLKKVEQFSELSKYIDIVSVSNILYRNIIDYNDVEYSGKNIILKPLNSIIVDSMVNNNIPFVVKQNNDNYSTAKFITYSSNAKSYSAIELGIYKNNDYTTSYDADKKNNINNMVQLRVVNNNSNTDLEFHYYKNDGSDIYKSFLEFTNNNSKTNMHLGQLTNVHNSNISLHINDDNKCGLQITNTLNPIKINLVNITASSNKYNIISSGDLSNNHKFTIDIANTHLNTEPTTNDLQNIFTIAPYNSVNNLRDGARYGFNEANPIQSMTINSEHDTQTMLINARYTRDYIYTAVQVNTSNLKQTYDYNSITDYWNNNSATYKTRVSNSIHNSNIPLRDINGDIVELENGEKVVYKLLTAKKDISYLSIHSNIQLKYIFDENKLNINSSNYSNYVTNFTNINGLNNPKYIVSYNSNTNYIFDISPLLSYDNNKIINTESTQLINNITSNNFSIVLNNGIINCNYNFACLFSNYYKVPAHLANISTSNTNTDIISSYTNIKNIANNTSSNFVSFINKIYTYLPGTNNNTTDKYKLFYNTTSIKLNDIGSLSNVYLQTTTSNIVRYNSLKQYEGKFAVFRNNILSIDSSNIIPNTISNSNYVINCNSNIQYYNNTNIYNNISNIINITTSNELVDDRYNTGVINERPIKEFKYNFNVFDVSLSNTIMLKEYFKGYVNNANNCNINIQLTNYNKPKFKPHIILSNTIKDDLVNRNNLTNEIYSYDGNLKFMYRDELFNQEQLLIDKTGNVKFFGSVSTSNDLYITGNIYNQYGSNIIDEIGLQISKLEESVIQQLLGANFALNSTIDDKDANISNYVLSTNNTITTKTNLNDKNVSNYILSTSNILILGKTQWTTSNKSIYFNTSNVGIGTSIPESKLHIYDDIKTTTNLLIQNNNPYILPAKISSTPITQYNTITDYTDRIVQFLYTNNNINADSNYTEYTFNLPNACIADILMIGAGGKGANLFGGGGGAGSCIVSIGQLLSQGNYKIRVGGGQGPENRGANSEIYFNDTILYRATGGGNGSGGNGADNNGIEGGCGGASTGAQSANNVILSRQGGIATNLNYINGIRVNANTITSSFANLGNKGGDNLRDLNIYNIEGAGGGGGIGSPGANFNSVNNPTSGGKGGDGLNEITINGKLYNFEKYFTNSSFGSFGYDGGYIGGGGGGGFKSYFRGTIIETSGLGGRGGGGNGATMVSIPLANDPNYHISVANNYQGVNNTGSGGGAGDLVNEGSSGGSGFVIIRYRNAIQIPDVTKNAYIELIRGDYDDMYTDYKIGNYDGEFKIISSTLGINTNTFIINQSSNITIAGNVVAQENVVAQSFIGSGHRLSGVLLTSNDVSLSNYILSTSNILMNRIETEVDFGSNYVLSTSDIISERISGLTTDMIYEPISANQRFIVNNRYDNDMFILGSLFVSSNLTIQGEYTLLETNIYTTERLEVVNEDINTVAMMVQQKNDSSDIFVAKNLNDIAFSIKNNGDVDIQGNYKKEGRNVITDTSNYVFATCNIIYDKIDDHVSTINGVIQTKDRNCSNYVLSASNMLATSLDFHKSKWTITSSNIYSMNNVSIGTTSNIDKLTVEGGIIASRGIVSSFSDNRLKDHTSNIRNPIDLICKLNGFHYTPNDLASHYGFPIIPDIGLSAQEVQSILPEIVKIAPFDMMRDDSNNIVSKSGDNYLTICYEKLAPLFVESIKALKKELNELKLEVAELRNGRD